MTKIAIVGAGLIGRSWATVFAGHGFDVALYDPSAKAAEAAKAHVLTELRNLADLGIIASDAAAEQRLSIVGDIAAAVHGAALVQESGPETVEAKQALFAEMDACAAPDTILASSTSFIMASRFTETLKGRGRCLVAHPANPPHLIPIVELSPAPWTDASAIARAQAIYEQAAQVPIVLRREEPGFVLNRLQAVLLAEAFRIVGAGIASPQDVDKTIKDGLGLRWSFMGPFETIELNAPGGIPDYCARYSASLAETAGQSGAGNPFRAETVEKIMAEWTGAQTPDRVARLSAWRDGRLAALKAHKLKAARKPE
jgi:L-gulonate 3-dehydrogenase